MKNFMTDFKILEDGTCYTTDPLYDPRPVIEDATVYIEEIYNNQRSTVTRYYGKQKDLVEKRAKRDYDATDYMRSPVLSEASHYRDGYAVTLKIYGLD